jgi:NADPH:quinone reductase-like Zn-dependent oxidoreductase
VIQLAKLHRADVISTASTHNLDYIRTLGADEGIDYTTTSFEAVVGKVDVVFDCVGNDLLTRSWNLLNPGGRAITIASSNEGSTDERVKNAFFIVEPKRQQLSDIAVLIDGGSLRSSVGLEVPLKDTAAAFAGTVQRKNGHGKIVLIPDDLNS